MSLEVDCRNDVPMINQSKEDPKYLVPRICELPSSKPLPLPYEQRRQNKHMWGLRPATLILSLALALMTVLAVVAAGVGASLAGKYKHQTTTPINPEACNVSSIPSNSTSAPANGSTFQPTDACASMGGSFNTSSPEFRFDLLCDTNLNGFDLVGIFAYALSDCIQACVNFNRYHHPENESCGAVTYDLGHAPKTDGNCFLKNQTSIAQQPLKTGSSAYMAVS